ncbi:MAG: 2TM domain-containing protein, partial [Deltaproteobacteria bacterium]|nr:2TM domain-containing protein [Deltaproteobacteria bacterium]
ANLAATPHQPWFQWPLIIWSGVLTGHAIRVFVFSGKGRFYGSKKEGGD